MMWILHFSFRGNTSNASVLMSKLYLNTRDEMTCVETDMISLVKADGNYSNIYYINGREIRVTFAISKMEEILRSQNDGRNRFVRFGRSFILNHYYIFKISPLKQTLILSDGGTNNMKVTLPKKLLKAYKDAILLRMERQNDNKI